jgi:chromosome segregation ATPase
MAGRSSSKLARRRSRLRRARTVAHEADAEVNRLEVELASSLGRTAELQAELAEIRDRAAALKKSIESTRGYQSKLRAARTQAGRDSAKARQRAAAVEQKYDRALLADMIKREKRRDLAEHPLMAPARSADASTPVPAPPPPATTRRANRQPR